MAEDAIARQPSSGVAQDRLPEAAREMKAPSNYANQNRQKAARVPLSGGVCLLEPFMFLLGSCLPQC
jgi:hypothetical protein